MFREGLEVRVLDSVTLEEANSDFVNWVRQRSRWYKGYLQTFLIHMRSPVALWREIGPRAMLQFVLFVGGTPLLALLNPVFWMLTIVWFVAHPPFELAVFPAPVYYAGIISWTLGNFTIAYLTIVCCRMTRRPEMIWAALLVPVYWIMMSLAAAKAALQLVFAPSFWEKTVHGLSHVDTRDRSRTF
jgi:cellulose synthase/poly-beta-1,6-N-acetylglucosamine synthase-like glycosyltransferase